MVTEQQLSLSAHPHTACATAMQGRLKSAITTAGGWLAFDAYMALVLYEPGLGYYSRNSRQFGHMPQSGSDFVTAPELSPLFGAALARQVGQALDAAQADTVYEFGAGSGALAEQLLMALGERVQHYNIIDLSGALRQRQAQRLVAFGDRVQWLNAWPELMHGVVLGNEVLDAMPVQLLHWDGAVWFERGVGLGTLDDTEQLAWADRPTTLRPPLEVNWPAGSVIEIHAQAEAFVRSLAERLQRGVALFIDYGFPDAEYYHPQRHQGTLMCHRLHQADTNPLADPGQKDITAHVNFSGFALAAQDAGMEVIGYTSQARFLMNCGVLALLQDADVRTRANTQKLLTEHEMGELFKVIGFSKGSLADPATGLPFQPLGFAAGDRTHTL